MRIKVNSLLSIGALILALGSCSSLTDSSEPSETTEALTGLELSTSDTFAAVDCDVDLPIGPAASCGVLTVPQDWDNPDRGEMVELSAAVLVDDETPQDAIPFVYLDGGPGGAILTDLDLAFPQLFGEIVKDRPVVVYSQRGAPQSSPDLVCEEVTEFSLETLDADKESQDFVEQSANAVSECATRLVGEGIDFAEVNSSNAAKDLDALRQALGYETWNVYGNSYGTRLAQSYVSEFPDSVKALVLDGVQPTVPELAVGKLAENAHNSIELMFVSCERDLQCAGRYPDLRDRFYSLYDQLEVEPVEFPSISLDTLEVTPVLWDGEALVASVFTAMYSRDTISIVPAMIEEMEQDSYVNAGLLASLEIFTLTRVATGMNSVVLCHDGFRHLDEATYLAGASDNAVINKVFGIDEDGFGELQQLCETYGDSLAASDDLDLVQSDVPALITSGEFDPITPTSNGDAVAAGFSNSTHVVFNGESHGVLGSECGTQAIKEFFADPSAEINSSCASQPNPIEWS